jgi:hypothetical protein
MLFVYVAEHPQTTWTTRGGTKAGIIDASIQASGLLVHFEKIAQHLIYDASMMLARGRVSVFN